MDTLEAIKSRRSIRHYDPTHELTDSEERTLFEHAILSPTSFNIQNWRFVVVKDTEQRSKIRQAAWDQAQVTDASLLIVMTADVKAWDKEPARYWKDASKEVGELMVGMMGPFYEGKEQLQRDEAMRSVGIAAQTIMLSAKSLGYDSGPMIGFDADQVAEIINLPADHTIGMIIVVGKKTTDAFPKPGQLPFDEVVIQDSF